MEYNAECASKWADKTTGATIVTGDQGDANVLEAFLAAHGQDFDIIVDDGGHTMAQQMTSLQHLWKAIKPGGMYFCEDLETSFIPHFGGGDAAKNAGTDTMVTYIHKMMEDLMSLDPAGPRQVKFEDVESIVHIDCSSQVCAFLKREE